MALLNSTQATIAFKNLLNKSNTDVNKGLGNEAESIAFNVHAQTIFADTISGTGATAVAAGIAVQVNAVLTLDVTSNGHAFFASWPVTPPTGTDPTTSNPYAYGAGLLTGITAGDRVRNAISFAFGNDYEAIPYFTSVAPANRIFVNDARNWVYQYNSGAFFQQDNVGPTPAFITIYAYTGKYILDVVGGGSSVVNVTAVNVSPDNTFLGTGSPTVLGYNQAIIYLTTFDFVNTGPITLDIDGVGAYPVMKGDITGLVPMAPGDIEPSIIYIVLFDGTQFQIFALGASGDAVGIRNFIPAATTITVPVNFQYLVYGNLTIAGDMINNGQVVILNGGMVLQGAGTFTNTGSLLIVDLQLGNEGKYTANFTTVANVPLTVTHGLATTDFVFTAKEGLNIIDVELAIVDSNNITITTTTAVSGRIVIISA